MGDGMAGNLAKGSTLLAMDRIFNDRPRRPEILAAIEKELEGIHSGRGGSVVDFMQAVATLPDDVIEHFRSHVFANEPPGFWPSYPDKDEIVLRALHKAFELAMADDLTIDSYWICAGHHFQTIVTRSAGEVNVCFLTPPLPANIFRPAETVPDVVWISCSEADARHLRSVAGYPIGDVLGNPTGEPRPPEQLPDFDPGLGVGGVQIVRPKRAPVAGA